MNNARRLARVILSVAQRSRTAKQHRAKRGGISGENTLKFHYRSRFAPSLGSGSTTKISHREIFSAQDDMHYVNISGRGELCSPAGAPRRSPTGKNVDFEKYQICFFFGGSKPPPYQIRAYIGRRHVFCRGRRPRRPEKQSIIATQTSSVELHISYT